MAKQIKISLLHEQVLLGSMLASKETRRQLIKSIQPSDFASSRHRAIFLALQTLDEKKLDYVPATLKTFLPNEIDWGGIEYLEKLEATSTNQNLHHHVRRAKWDRARSVLLGESISELETALKDPRLEVDDAIRLLNKMQDTLNMARDKSAVITGMVMVARYTANLYARESGGHLCSSGYSPIDRKLTNPFGKGLITIIAAAPSIGKTTFALNMAYRQSSKWRVCYLAWESGNIAATDILCASALNINIETLVKYPHNLNAATRAQIDKMLTNVFAGKGNLIFLERPPKGIARDATGPWEVNERVLDWFESQLSTIRPDIVYWDLFEKMLPDRRPQAISWALDRVQEMAQEYAVHIALLHQITFKEAEKKVDKRPSRNLLKGSGAYIEVPDVVFGLYRRAVYEPGITDDEFEVYCLKQRIGPWPWRLIFDWEGKFSKISGGREAQLTIVSDDETEADI